MADVVGVLALVPLLLPFPFRLKRDNWRTGVKMGVCVGGNLKREKEHRATEEEEVAERCLHTCNIWEAF